MEWFHWPDEHLFHSQIFYLLFLIIHSLCGDHRSRVINIEGETERSQMRNKIYQCVKECYKEKFPKTWKAKTKELWDEAKKETDL